MLTALVAAGDDLAGAPSWPTDEFHFVRMYYDSGGRWGRGGWRTDYPDAEYHFTMGVGRLTRVEIGQQARILEVTDDMIFDYPWLYAVEVGSWYLDDVEAARLREYLLRGGFLMTDDFHGSRQWAAFVESMQRVFPDRPIVEIPDHDEVKHVLYDLEAHIQIPGIDALMTGSPTSGTASRRIGAASTTTPAGSWSQSTSTWTWATRGSTRTIRAIPSR